MWDEMFTRFISENEAQIVGIAYRYVGNRDDAEEIAQATLVHLYQRPHYTMTLRTTDEVWMLRDLVSSPNPECRAAFKAYVLRSVHRRSIDFQRRAPDSWPGRNVDEHAWHCLIGSEDDDAITEHVDYRHSSLRALIVTLTHDEARSPFNARQRQVLQWWLVNELDYESIATLLTLSEAGTRVYTAAYAKKDVVVPAVSRVAGIVFRMIDERARAVGDNVSPFTGEEVTVAHWSWTMLGSPQVVALHLLEEHADLSDRDRDAVRLCLSMTMSDVRTLMKRDEHLRSLHDNALRRVGEVRMSILDKVDRLIRDGILEG